MATIDFDQIPAGEQMVDNWGQPTTWMQALWQRLTDKMSGEIARVDQNVSDVASAASTANSAATAATAAATAASTASSQALAASSAASTASSQALSAASAASTAASAASTASGQALAAQADVNDILAYFADFITYQNAQNVYFNALGGLLLELMTVLDDGTQPLSPPVVPASFTNYSNVASYVASPPTAPTPPT